MKKIIIAIALSMVFSIDLLAAAGDQVTTASKVIGNIRMQDYGNGATYYFVPVAGTWDAPGCDGVLYAYLDENSPIAEAVLSSALTSKTANLPISFYGICGNGSGNTQYLQIQYAVF